MPVLLVIIPHPDDESYAFGGTMALAAEAGWRVIVVCATYGEQGERHDGIPAEPSSLSLRRADELRESCRVLGADLPRFWHLPDGGLANEPDQSGRIAEIIRLEEPSLVLCLGADGAYGHPDHLAVYRWTLDATERVGDAAPPLLLASFPHGLFVPQYQLCISMMGDPPNPPESAIGSNTPDLRLPIGSVLPLKLSAIASHRTQLPNGDPRELFPAGIVNRLLDEERYILANPAKATEVSGLVRAIAIPRSSSGEG